MMENIWHIVLISFKTEVGERIKKEIHDRYQTLNEECGGKDAGILFGKIDYNLDLRKNVHLVGITIFKNASAMQSFQQHPKHKEFGNMLSQVADWQVGDIHHPFSLE